MAFERARARCAPNGEPFYVLGEVYGRGVQDLHYGVANPTLAVFDAYVGEPGRGRYLSTDEVKEALGDLFALVPTLYEGPFSEAVLRRTHRRDDAPRRRARARGRGSEACARE